MPIIPDIFGERVELPGGGHADAISPARAAGDDAVAESKDATGHDHKGKGPGGGQFTGSGGGSGGGKLRGATVEHATPEERAASRKLARKKVKEAPVPPPEKVKKMRAALEAAKSGGRPGGDARGSAASRRQRRRNLFTEWGGDDRGYIACPWTGVKMHWSSDPAENPKGYVVFEQGKIFVARQGGGYQLPNLIPENPQWNASRNDKTVREENLD